METPVDYAARRNREGASHQQIGAELEAGGANGATIAIALSLLADAAPAVEEASPYQRALKLKREGLSDEAIARQLTQGGLDTADADFVVRSLPGGALGSTEAPRGEEPGGGLQELAVSTAVDQLGGAVGLPLGPVFDVLRALTES